MQTTLTIKANRKPRQSTRLRFGLEKKAAFAKADPELQQYIVDDLKAKDAEKSSRQMEAAELRRCKACPIWLRLWSNP